MFRPQASVGRRSGVLLFLMRAAVATGAMALAIAPGVVHGAPPAAAAGAKATVAKPAPAPVGAAGSTATGPVTSGRYTAETPDAIVDTQKKRATAAQNDADRMAALTVIASLADRATHDASLKATRE